MKAIEIKINLKKITHVSILVDTVLGTYVHVCMKESSNSFIVH